MAKRTIRARRASPYLLYLVIAFSILTVAGAVGWGWIYSLRSQEQINVFGPDRLREAAETGADLWRDVMAKYQAEGANLLDVLDAKDRLATEYRSEIQRLTAQMVDNPFSTQAGAQLRQSVSDVIKSTTDLLAQTTQTLQTSYQVGAQAPAEVKTASLQEAINALKNRIMALVQQIKQDSTALATLDTQLKGVQDELAAAKAAHKTQVEQLQANLTDEKNRLTAARDDAVKQTNQFKEEMQRITDRLIAERRQWTTDREKLQREILTLQNNLKDLGQEVATFRKVPTETGIDGRIVRIAEQGAVAYGDLGKKDGVLLGMTFSIFGQNELGKTDPKPKAQCRIVKIMEDACELRVYQLRGDNPVVTGDVLHNPIYDRSRRLRFALVGKMDIDGDSIDDTEQLKALVQEFGGRIDTQVSVQTDYLVIGEEPPVVAAPAPTAGPMERQVYEEARKKFIDYTEAKARAENFSIPVLSLNRFLGLVGIAGQM